MNKCFMCGLTTHFSFLIVNTVFFLYFLQYFRITTHFGYFCISYCYFIASILLPVHLTKVPREYITRHYYTHYYYNYFHSFSFFFLCFCITSQGNKTSSVNCVYLVPCSNKFLLPHSVRLHV